MRVVKGEVYYYCGRKRRKKREGMQAGSYFMNYEFKQIFVLVTVDWLVLKKCLLAATRAYCETA
jgi:hypothetical protein